MFRYGIVVYLLNPTSNHNRTCYCRYRYKLYIFWILHQTTTCWRNKRGTACCISFESYIKPQQSPLRENRECVVYLLNPTSNHNTPHKTENAVLLYIFWILHQTTTYPKDVNTAFCCISFESYIKPQLLAILSNLLLVVYLLNPTSNHNDLCEPPNRLLVVYLLNPTSNHNKEGGGVSRSVLYIFWILHQTTTLEQGSVTTIELYIFWILHQTTTSTVLILSSTSCISFESYIKPQQLVSPNFGGKVVYLLNPTSNHNSEESNSVGNRCISFESYIKPQQSIRQIVLTKVVYLLNPTSNHNYMTNKEIES